MSECGPLGRLELTVNPGRLAWIIDSAVVACTDVVNFHFAALAQADLGKPPSVTQSRYQYRTSEISAEERRRMHENWILSKAFHELLRAVRHSLEEAYVIVMLLTRSHRVKTSDTLAEFFEPFLKKASGLNFPDLLAAVNRHMDPKIDFAEGYMSLQAARNCLEHRDGIVSKVDTRGEETFTLRIPRAKIFYLRQGVEIELVPGHTIDPGDHRTEVDALMKFETRERSIKLGERLTLTLVEFEETAFACHILGQQLSTKLPKPAI